LSGQQLAICAGGVSEVREFPMADLYEFQRPTLRQMYNMRKANMDCIRLRIVSIGNPIHVPQVTTWGDISTPSMAVIYSLN